jgi:aminoglycoside 6-adenylyltransferase
MPPLPDEAQVLAKLVAWGEADEGIRALILTSSRARRDETVDQLSDYDVIVAVRDPVAFARDDSLARALGRPLVRWGDQGEVLGVTMHFLGVVYDDAVKVDFTLWPVELLERVAASPVLPDDLDVGYRVLLDKDGPTSRWQEPTYRAHIPAKPKRAEYDAQVEEFWWSTTYAAKGLWRGEVVFVKFVLDFDSKLGPLRRFLEWRIELDHEWRLRPGAFGRGLERLLPTDLRDELAGTYVGSEVADNWDALFRTTALFRRVATEVGDAFGYRYPQEIDDAVTAQLRAVRSLPPRSY